MREDISEWTQDIHVGDARDRLADLPSDAVHCVMTSPPYFGLRDYGEKEQIGLEDSLDAYISELMAVFDELRRVVRDDGSVWLNLGDSYGDGKQKLLVPHRVAIALQEAGWVVRNDVTWCLAATTKVYARTQKREGPNAQWCERHTIRFPGHRKRAFIPAGSPQLTLSEVQVL